MTTITLLSDEEGILRGLEAHGHSGYAKSGRDILCSAISALTINLANSVSEFTEDDFACEIVEKNGDFSFRIRGEISKESILLLKSCALDLQSIAEEYGTTFITIKHDTIDSSGR